MKRQNQAKRMFPAGPTRTALAIFISSCILLLCINTVLRGVYLKNASPAKEEIITKSEDFYKKNGDARNSADPVEVGVYIDSLFDLDLKNSTFKATGWMWYSWIDKCKRNACATPDDPYGKFDLNYVSDDANKQAASFGAPTPWDETGKKPGWMWNEINFGGSFYTKLDLRKFPFDTQNLQIRITSPEYEADEVRYMVDEFSAPISQILIPGYDIVGTRVLETVREYASKFGFTGDASNTRQSQLIAELIITRNLSASIFRYFLPIIVVLAVTLITTKLDPAYWEAKLATPSTAILSLLFLQDGFRSDLPTTAYLSVLDFYFGISYLILLLSLLDASLEVGWGRPTKKTTSSDSSIHSRVSSSAINNATLPEKLAITLFAVSPVLTYLYYLIA